MLCFEVSSLALNFVTPVGKYRSCVGMSDQGLTNVNIPSSGLINEYVVVEGWPDHISENASKEPEQMDVQTTAKSYVVE